jgi:thiosulfate dehydrogenase [quinone] large subunit
MKTHPNFAILLLRLPLGALFVYAGMMKFMTMGYSNFVRGSAGTIPAYLPRPLGMGYLYAVPFAEVIVGVLLVIGLVTRLSAVATALMLLSFMMAVTGFKGEHGGPHPSLFYMCMAIAIALAGAGRYSIDAKWRKAA